MIWQQIHWVTMSTNHLAGSNFTVFLFFFVFFLQRTSLDKAPTRCAFTRFQTLAGLGMGYNQTGRGIGDIQAAGK